MKTEYIQNRIQARRHLLDDGMKLVEAGNAVAEVGNREASGTTCWFAPIIVVTQYAYRILDDVSKGLGELSEEVAQREGGSG